MSLLSFKNILIMKLELKHLAPYLPYGLKCQIVTNPLKGEVHKLSGLIYDGYYTLGKGGRFGFIHREPSQFKPILRPLSELMKEAETGTVNFGYDLSVLEKVIETKDTQQYQNFDYSSMLYFFKNHFDVFGLIDKGLAVDINTVE